MMKFRYSYHPGEEGCSAEYAVPKAVSSSMDYSGQIESLTSENRNLQDLVGRLIDVLCDRGGLTGKEAASILGYGWETIGGDS